ncbi:S16 family serine protease [Haploplasma axanthum]|uniref:Predicted secreted protein containing a PDZ domain n=1 Tax=Haploplasma axanthum TaxID=29552 RepID=A0A449BEE4_HAPAX|nr:S16 family serine protease [Haploplasma axanthum]VEU80798.1 Predicted secreted protein containing a PDZ domain [Haploplasma axanthum]
MLKILNKYKKWIIIFSFAYVYIVFMLIAPSGYSAITPGEVMKTANVYKIEGKEFENDINTVAVYSWQKISIFQKWLIEDNKNYDFFTESEYEKSLSRNELSLRGKISHDSSNNNAIITAYTYANKVNSNVTIDYSLEGLSVYGTNNPDLKIGDLIIGINDSKFNNNDYISFLNNLEILNENYLTVIDTNKDYSFNVLRNKEEIKINVKNNQRIQFYPNYKINSATPSYNGTKDQGNVGGPSGGMIQTLAIYTSLLDIKFDNLKIAGTGTIEMDSNSTVGKIGGLPQKFITIKKAKVDLFIVPESQYNEIKEQVSKQTNVEVVTVSSFEDVITKVINVRGNK